MPLQATSGAASQDAFGGNGVAVVPAYIEDVFSCFLYTGNGATQTITNGIDLSTNGGLVWVKTRTTNTGGGTYNNSNILADSARTPSNILRTNGTEAQDGSPSFSSFNSNGFTLGTSANTNNTGVNSVSWTFRKQPKFFDIVTWTGTGATGAISHSHSLGSEPGCIIIKAVSTNEGHWYVYHRSLGVAQVIALNLTNASSSAASPDAWTVSSTQFSVNTSQIGGNTNGTTYVAYLFAHNAGGFGLTGADNVISCGSFTGSATSADITLGYEPQWILYKQFNGVAQWNVVDNMRGLPSTPAAGNYARSLTPNTSVVEDNRDDIAPTATGFKTLSNSASNTYIYIAIRRGPMKVPTTGTSVFAPVNQTGGGTVTTNFPVDLVIATTPSQSSYRSVNDRLRGGSTTRGIQLYTNVTNAEAAGSFGFGFDNNTGYIDGLYTSSFSDLYLNFRRAPSFFDEVCYTGTGANATVTHNLGVAPELLIVRNRSSGGTDWVVWSKSGTQLNSYSIALNSSNAYGNSGDASWGTVGGTPNMNSSSFSLGDAFNVNFSGPTYVAYLFATCAGVSKVGSYTGTGTTLQVNCGFTTGARFVLIKRTDSTGDWYVWDSARGIIAGNDPYLLLNSTAAEVAGTDYVDTYSAGFEISSTAPAAINASAGTFIFLAIA